MDGNIKPKNKCTKYKLEIHTWSKKKNLENKASSLHPSIEMKIGKKH